MAAQDYNTISQPALGVEASTLSLVVKKQDKKQQKELAHLTTVLRTVEEELASAKSGAALGGSEAGADVAKAGAPTAPAGPGNKSIEDILSKMAGALQLLQVQIAKYADKKASSESKISEAERNIAQDNLNKANKALKKLMHEIEKQKTMGFWMKFGEVLAGVLLTIVAVVLEQPELLIAAVICFAGAAGLLSKASDGIAKGLEAMGVPPEVAKILGGVIVTLLVIALTAGAASFAGVGTGAAAAADTAADATEEGMEMTEMGASIGEDAGEATSETADSSNALSKAAKVFKKLNFFRKFGAKTNLMIMAGAQSASQTKVLSNIVGELAYAIAEGTGHKKEAEKDKKEAEMIAGIIVELMTVIASVGSISALGEGASSAANMAEDATENTSALSRVFSGFKELGLSSTGQRIMMAINVLTQLEIFSTGVAGSSFEIEQGEGQIALSKYQADTILNNIAIGMNNNEMSSSQKFIAQREKQFKTSDKAIVNVMKGEEAFAQLLCTSMV